MQLNNQFREFVSQIRPTDKQKEDWKVGSTTLRSRLENDLTLKHLVVATFLQGSVRRSTAIRPAGDKRPDVDVVVVTTIDTTTTTPQQALDKFKPFLNKHYEGKWRPQDRSFGIELSYVDLDLVITALPADQKSRVVMESLYRSQAVLTTETIEDDRSWRLNESWRPGAFLESARSSIEDAPAEQWRPHPLLLPDREVGRWGRTHPLAQIQWTAEKNRGCNGHYVNIVRALKWWRQTNGTDLPKYPKGYPLEHIIGHVLSNGTSSMASGVVEVFENIRDDFAPYAASNTVPRLSDHGVPEHDVLKRLEASDFKAFHSAASEAAAIARDALECDEAQKSAELWQRLFGDRFPLPGPQGGDRVTFTEPSRPAEPRQSGRFA